MCFLSEWVIEFVSENQPTMVYHIGLLNRGIRNFLNACSKPITRMVIGHVDVSLVNQPKQMQRFGNRFVVPRIQIAGCKTQAWVVVSLVTEDLMKAHPNRLEGPGCKQGVCIHKTGQVDAFKRHCDKAYEDYWPTRPGEHRSKEQVRKYERKVTWSLFKSLCQLVIEMFFARTIVEIPDLVIKPTSVHSVRQVLTEREKFSRRRTDFMMDLNAPPLGDPWKLGFKHKNEQNDLSAVRLDFQVHITVGAWTVNKCSLTTDVIYDSTPRILESSLHEALPEGGSLMSLKVNRDDVAVEFFDKQTPPWSVRLEVGSESGSGFEALDLESEEQIQGPYTATLDVEVPAYPKISAASQQVFVKIVTRGKGEESEPLPFTYLPSKDAALILQAQKEEAEKPMDYISRMMENKDKPDYMAMLKKQAEEAPPVRIVLRPQREKRESKELPSYVTDKEHKHAKQEQIMANMFKQTKGKN